ncbi:ABC transporter ATP-binding protein [Microvirga antarctica]|uniref:ABC transporter ATP-binding protein n=1 Tax=Microvirga antarctica TaxID=2819233 RepID=UPI001B31182E|nr:ABC transporter ATP-binding protein [Microvirga antarctica]
MLSVSNVTKRFGGLVAVSDASLKVDQGRIVALIGPNGAGKTTLFAIIGGFVTPDSGRIQFEGRDITGMPPHAICRLGLTRTFQIVQPFAGLTVRENIAIGAHLRHRGRAEALERAAIVGEQVGMGPLLDQPAQSLTVAGRKRLELARALATEAKLLLLDEVMAGLIPSEITEIVATIRKIRDSGVTILLIEHVMQAVMSLSEEAYVLNQGRMIAHGTPAQLVADPTVIEAYLGHGAAERLKQESDNA